MAYTLAEAAPLVGRTKSALMKAVQSGRLAASRQPDGTLLVELDELNRVFPVRTAVGRPRKSAAATAPPPPPEKPAPPAGRPALGSESREIIYRGASVNQLAEIFRIRDETVARKIAGIEPAGTGKNGVLIYRIADVAPRLVQIPITPEMIEEYIHRMRPSELPPALQKSYWDGRLAQHRFGAIVGELWPTEEVQAVASAVFQGLREALLLLPDKLKGEIPLDDAQSDIVQRIVDRLIEGLREQLIADLQSRGRGRSAAAAAGHA